MLTDETKARVDNSLAITSNQAIRIRLDELNRFCQFVFDNCNRDERQVVATYVVKRVVELTDMLYDKK